MRLVGVDHGKRRHSRWSLQDLAGAEQVPAGHRPQAQAAAAGACPQQRRQLGEATPEQDPSPRQGQLSAAAAAGLR